MSCFCKGNSGKGTGHVSRMDNTRTVKAVFKVTFVKSSETEVVPWALRKRSLSQARQRCYENQLKWQLTRASSGRRGWKQPATDTGNWRATTRRPAQDPETSRREDDEERRRRKKESATHAILCRAWLC